MIAILGDGAMLIEGITKLWGQGCDNLRIITYDESPAIGFLEYYQASYSTNRRDARKFIGETRLILSLGYRDRVPKTVLEIAPAVNLHLGLLPQYGGAEPNAHALSNGESMVGFTYHYMTDEINAGNILAQNTVRVQAFDTATSLRYRVMSEALQRLPMVVNRALNGSTGNPPSGEIRYFGGDA